MDLKIETSNGVGAEYHVKVFRFYQYRETL